MVTEIELLELSDRLLAKPTGWQKEPCYRASAGRAYYAAFVALRDHLSNHFQLSRGHEIHGDVCALLDRSTDETVSGFAGRLRRLRLRRNRADYDVGKQTEDPNPYADDKEADDLNYLAKQLIADLRTQAARDPKLFIRQ